MHNVPSTLQISCVQMHWATRLERNLEVTLEHIAAAAREGSRVVVFPEANLTSYYFPYVNELADGLVGAALERVRQAARDHDLWVICGTLRRRRAEEKLLNVAHVIAPHGEIVHEYAKTHMAGRDEKQWCRPGNKLSLFPIDGVQCTLVICRDGRHPELYRVPGMAGAQILFQPSCSSDEVEAVIWKRTSGRAQQPAGPNSKMFHCVANTVGQSPDGLQTSSGQSFIREPNGMPLAEAGYYQEERITAVLDIARADRGYVRDSFENPPVLRRYWQAMTQETVARKDWPADPMEQPAPKARVVDFADVPGVPCPCGTARRAFAGVPESPGTIHVTEIKVDAELHYHQRTTETYYFLECEEGAAMELDGERVAVRPGCCVLIPPGVKHRAVGRAMVLLVAVPQFDPADEFVCSGS